MKRILIALLLCIPITANAMTMAIIDANMQLTGFTNVDVNGTLFNVTLDTGSCVELYTGCDELSDFPFSILDAATALNALRSSISDPAGLLIPEINSISDCVFSCFIAIADGLQGNNVTQTQINIASAGGGVGLPSRALGDDTRSNEVFAVFSPVPLPAAFQLFLAGIAGLGVLRLRKLKVQPAA